MLTENKLSKYFFYAIGEIVLVVIGILIALTINNWNENRKKGIKETQFLESFKIDLRANKIELDRVIKKTELTKNMADYARIKELQGKTFVTKEFFDTLNSIGNIPISLGHWQMKGQKKHLTPIFSD